MMKIQIKYENESDKEKLIKGLSKEFKIVNMTKPNKIGKFYRMYVEVKCKNETEEKAI